MTASPKPDFMVRPLQYRDWDSVEGMLNATNGSAERSWLTEPLQRRIQAWDRHPMLKVLDALPGRWSSSLRTYVAEQNGQLVGLIQVSPFNQSRSTWRIEQVCISPGVLSFDVGTQLIRYCLESIWEARTWLVEVEINQTDSLGLYRQNGFQPLAQLTQWQLSPQSLAQLTTKPPSLPNLLPINNADAALLHQLDTAAMPPFVRQVFDRHVQDFQRSVFNQIAYTIQSQLQRRDWVNGYVFEPQRKAAIGYFAVYLSKTERDAHVAQMTVHPAYTWLYSGLLTYMAQLCHQSCAAAPMSLVSADYQAEREDYLEQIGAERAEHTMMLSRSVWHKVKESKTISLETLQLTEMLQGLQPNQTPVPGRMMLLTSLHPPIQDRELRGSKADRRTTQNGGKTDPRST
jgi:ribosomal protein S18 acetylase RimI-like enzyme